jgi:hypothetical protein
MADTYRFTRGQGSHIAGIYATLYPKDNHIIVFKRIFLETITQHDNQKLTITLRRETAGALRRLKNHYFTRMNASIPASFHRIIRAFPKTSRVFPDPERAVIRADAKQARRYESERPRKPAE